MKRSIILLLVALVLVFALSFVSPSEAQKTPKPIVLKGTYGTVGHDVCIAHWTTNNFNPSLPDVHFTKTSTLHGTTVFDGSATASFDGYEVTISHPIYTPIPDFSYWGNPATAPVGFTNTTHIISSITSITIDPVTRFITREVSASGTFIGGIVGGQDAAGKTFTLESYELDGYVSLDLGTLEGFSPVDPTQPTDYNETLTIKNSDGTIFGVQTQQCQRIRVSTQLK